MIKIDEKAFPVTFTVVGEVEVDKEQLKLKLAEVKQKLQEQEDLYYQKRQKIIWWTKYSTALKRQKTITGCGGQQMLTNHLEEAQVNVDMVVGRWMKSLGVWK